MTTTNPKPRPPALPIRHLTADELEPGMIVPVRAEGVTEARFKTVTEINGRANGRWITVTFDDDTSVDWQRGVRVAVTDASLPASYWRGQYESLRAQMDKLRKSWLALAVNILKPGNHPDTPNTREGRARQARHCAADVANLLGGKVAR